MPALSLERGSLQQMFIDPMVPALTVGAVTGAAGIIAGGFQGLLVSRHPVLFATAGGVQWFGLGSTFWYFRYIGPQSPPSGSMSTRESVLRSTLAGSMTGAVHGVFRSRSNVLPAALVFGIFGMLGQGAYNTFQAKEVVNSKVPWVQRVLDSRWIPLKRLSDDDYLEMLSERAIKVDAEIAIIDERIATLQKSRKNGG